MGILKKNPDPISERSRELAQKIAELEGQISKLSRASKRPPVTTTKTSTPRWRSSAVPRQAAQSQPSAVSANPVIDEVDQRSVKSTDENHAPEHLNELGVRKYDLADAWQRFKTNFAGPTTSNPKLVSYLAAGSVQGLRPLRYEKRVARNRFRVLLAMVLFLLWGIIAIVVGRH